MADDRAKSTGTSRGRQDSVLGSLPATRPARIGRTRREVKATAAKPRGPRPAKPKPPRAKAAAPKRGKPVAVTAGCPPLERPKPSEAPPPQPIGAPSGAQLVTTAIQATGELARIGLTVGGQVLKRAVDRLPRP
jgi:hypothetical protein